MLLLIHGENLFAINKYLDQLIRDRDSKIIHGEELQNFSELFQNADNFSLFSTASELTLVKNFISTQPKAQNDSLAEELLRRKKLNFDLVFFEKTKVDKRSKFYKALTKIGKIEEFALLTEKDLFDWVREEFANDQIKIDNFAIQQLISKVGYQQDLLTTEIAKLCLLVKARGKKVITAEELDAVFVSNSEYNIWQLLDALSAKNKVQAIDLCNSLLVKNEDFSYLATMLARQLKILLIVKESDRFPQTLKKMNLHPFVLKKATQYAVNFPLNQIKQLYQKLSDLDFAVKTGKIDARLGLNMFLLSI